MQLTGRNEAARLELLRMLDILDSTSEPAFDALAQAASLSCRCPISLISLIDVDRQWFKAATGLAIAQTPRSQSFCAHAIEGDALLEVPNALDDPRFASNPLVTGDPQIRFYAGQPILYDGIALGALCVIDRMPRQLDDTQRAVLRHLSLVAAELLQGRMDALLHRAELAAATSRERESTLRKVATQVPGLIYQFRRGVDGRFSFPYASERMLDVFELAPETVVADASPVFALVHPEDLADVTASVARSYETGAIWHARFRVRLPRKGLRWLQGSSLPEPLPDGTTVWHGYVTDVTESHARDRDFIDTHAALEANERRLRALTDNLPAVITHIDLDERYTFTNARIDRIFGGEQGGMIGRTVLEVRGPDIYANIKPYMNRVMAGEVVSFEGSGELDGDRYFYLATYVPDIGADGQQHGFLAISFDISARKKAEMLVAASEKRLRDITDNLPVLVSYIDAEERMTYANDAFLRLVGATREELIGRKVADAMGPVLYEQRRDYLHCALTGERVSFEVQSFAGSELKHLKATYIPNIDRDGKVLGVTTLSIDVTDLKLAESRLSQLAHFDQLTGLPNRLQFNQRLADCIDGMPMTARVQAVMFLDVDHFKNINDTYGHGVGDAVLQQVATRIQRNVRSTDFVARLAGDEFVVILDDLESIVEAEAIGRTVVAAIERPFYIDGRPLNVTISVGVAMRDGDTVDVPRMMAKADKALYGAKDAGRNTCCMSA